MLESRFANDYENLGFGLGYVGPHDQKKGILNPFFFLLFPVNVYVPYIGLEMTIKKPKMIRSNPSLVQKPSVDDKKLLRPQLIVSNASDHR